MGLTRNRTAPETRPKELATFRWLKTAWTDRDHAAAAAVEFGIIAAAIVLITWAGTVIAAFTAGTALIFGARAALLAAQRRAEARESASTDERPGNGRRTDTG